MIIGLRFKNLCKGATVAGHSNSSIALNLSIAVQKAALQLWTGYRISASSSPGKNYNSYLTGFLGGLNEKTHSSCSVRRPGIWFRAQLVLAIKLLLLKVLQ
jgi:hypothetical protein